MPIGRAEPYDVKTILVPTDFSEGAQAALEHAAALAKAFKAKIVVLHVIETIAATMAGTVKRVDPKTMAKGISQVPDLTDVYAIVRRAVEPVLSDLVASLQKDGVAATSALAQGAAYAEIVAQSDAVGADLIVMGTHGRRGVNRLFMGSVAERVVRLAPCPVLTLRPPHGAAQTA